MPTVAQKLCHDIVEPVLKQSSTNDGKVKSTSKFAKSSSISKQNAKPMQRVHIDQKTNSKIKTTHIGGTTITKSKTSILTNLAETAVNTLVSGPLRCDNNCVTLVRKRDYQSSCKCGHRRANIKASTKSIQTLNKNNFSLPDKACTHCVETVTCGTQLLDKTNSRLNEKKEIKSRSKTGVRLPEIPRNSFRPRIESDQCHTGESFRDRQVSSVNSKPPILRYVTAKRWALSNYPTRGPDF